MMNLGQSDMPIVRSGLDVLLHERHGLLKGQRVGLVTSSSAITRRVEPAAEALNRACTVTALFGPEHGIHAYAADGAAVQSTTDSRTGLPIYSLYGKTKQPTAEMLHGIDVLLFDIQDVGVRFYTYIWTMSYVLQAAAEHRVPLVILDRPNPIGGHIVQGPGLEPGYESFVGRYPIPLRHGLTMGELARWLDQTLDLNADLTVIRTQGWQRSMWFDQTGLPWVQPSPAMPKLETAAVYPGMCLLEGTNVSAGRGTATPFEGIGAPWIDAYRLTDALNALNLPGVRFRPIFFTPSAQKYAGETCQGTFVHVLDRERWQPIRAGLHLVALLRRSWPQEFVWRSTSWEGRPPHFDLLIGNGWVRPDIETGRAVDEIVDEWQDEAATFARERQADLLYD